MSSGRFLIWVFHLVFECRFGVPFWRCWSILINMGLLAVEHFFIEVCCLLLSWFRTTSRTSTVSKMSWVKFTDNSGCFLGRIFILQDPTDYHFHLCSRASSQADVRVQPLYEHGLLCVRGAVRLNVMEDELIELLKAKSTSCLKLFLLEGRA